MKLDIWHNLAWSRYKGAVFTALARQVAGTAVDVHVTQIALTDRRRAALSDVAMERFDYPHKVLFRESYDDISRLPLYSRVLREAWSTDADVTIIPGVDRPEYWLQALVLAIRGRKRAVFFDSTRFDRPQRPLRRFAKRMFFKLVPWTLSYGERSRAYAISLGIRAERALVRPQAAYLPAGYDARHMLAQRKQHGDPSKRVFLYVGRLSPEKGIDTLIDAFSRYRSVDPQAQLRIVGSGPEETALKALAAEHGMEGSVVFPGAMQDDTLQKEYLCATALVLPSRSEPWGLVVNEALHHGCPVIVSDRCGCVPELVAGSPCGIVVPAGDANALAEALAEAANALADRETTALRCLEKVAPYSPDAAASAILVAARTISAD